MSDVLGFLGVVLAVGGVFWLLGRLVGPAGFGSGDSRADVWYGDGGWSETGSSGSD